MYTRKPEPEYQLRLFDLRPVWKPHRWRNLIECWDCKMWIEDGQEMWIQKTEMDFDAFLEQQFRYIGYTYPPMLPTPMITHMVPMHGYCAVIDAFDSEK
jgi:hypothetical protein